VRIDSAEAAATFIDSHGASAEQRLALAVILRAIADACGDAAAAPTPAGKLRAQREARTWFEEAGPSFRMWCGIAGMHPDDVRRRAVEVFGRTPMLPGPAPRPTPKARPVL
jgi:hypothetical protein